MKSTLLILQELNRKPELRAKYLFEYVGEKVSSQVTGHTITQMAVEYGEEAKLMILITLVLCYMVVLHVMARFPFNQVESMRHLGA